uniref:Succinate dehydrogenase assembly factor 4, mitochondrial n=1 Tax=Romanomermis culicivorax TaxID=13658 RepID=A0A915JCD3_ROMCU
LREDNEQRTPRGRLDNLSTLPKKSDIEDKSRHRDAEKEPLSPWPNGVNPHTGEKGGPKGPEPTRYGDWERKGRVSDF